MASFTVQLRLPVHITAESFEDALDSAEFANVLFWCVENLDVTFDVICRTDGTETTSVEFTGSNDDIAVVERRINTYGDSYFKV